MVLDKIEQLKLVIETVDNDWEAANKVFQKEYDAGHDTQATEAYERLMALSKERSYIYGELWKLMDELKPDTQSTEGGGKTRRGKHRGGTMPKTRRNKSSGGDIVTHLLTIRNQVKLYHWQTGSFARHKATDDLTAALDLNIDAFVESYMGRYGRPKVTGNLPLHNFSESSAKAFVERETKYLETELPKKIGKNDTDLLNLRDTILGDLTKVSYLFTLA
jgi:hypothetical protein